MSKDVCYRDEIVGLIGNPVDDNPTVVVMEEAFKALGLKYRYNTMQVFPEDLATAIEGIRAYNFRGSHITDPYKISCIPYLDRLSQSASLIGAVNTIVLENRELIGYNTDGKGFIRSLKDENVDLNNREAAVLGSDGHARAICTELGLNHVSKIDIISRDGKEAKGLQEHLISSFPVKCDVIGWETKVKIPSGADLLVNCTADGSKNNPVPVPDIDFDTVSERMIVCDIVDNPIHTLFLQRAEQIGCKTIDGFSMLVNLAAYSFNLWTGMDAPTDVMSEALLTTL